MARLTPLARSQQDPTAFEAFYRAHAPALLRYFERRTPDVEVAADLTAETFARAFEHRGQFRGTTEREAGGWLYAIARRQLVGFERRGLVEERAVARLAAWEPQVSEDEHERVEALADLGRLRAELTRALKELTPPARLAVRLRVLDGLDYLQIAERLGMNEPAARARVSRALRELRGLLSD